LGWGQTMLSKADECRAKAFECLERAARTRDASRVTGGGWRNWKESPTV